MAIRAGRIESVLVLLELGVDPNGPTETGAAFREVIVDQPLRAAMELGQADIVEVLLNAGATLAGRISNNEHALLKMCKDHPKKYGSRICELTEDDYQREGATSLSME